MKPTKPHLRLVGPADLHTDAPLSDEQKAIARAKISVGNALIKQGLDLLRDSDAPPDLRHQWEDACRNEQELRRLIKSTDETSISDSTCISS